MRNLLLILSSCVLLSGCLGNDDVPVTGAIAVGKSEIAPSPIIGGNDILAKGPAPIDFQTFKKRAESGKYAVTDVEKIRRDVLAEAATAYASQAGYYKRAYDIMRQLEVDSPKLSKAFNFNRVVYVTPKEAGFVVPPIVTRGSAALNINDTGTKSVAADEYYRIERPGRLVGVVPTWRDYLVLPLEEPNEPDADFIPQDDEEKKIWEAYLDEGWLAGVSQADEALKASMNELRRDYLGMVEYRRLVDAGLIKELAIVWKERRSSGDINELFIGERTVKIVDAATFVHNPKNWKPVTRRFASTQ